MAQRIDGHIHFTTLESLGPIVAGTFTTFQYATQGAAVIIAAVVAASRLANIVKACVNVRYCLKAGGFDPVLCLPWTKAAVQHNKHIKQLITPLFMSNGNHVKDRATKFFSLPLMSLG